MAQIRRFWRTHEAGLPLMPQQSFLCSSCLGLLAAGHPVLLAGGGDHHRRGLGAVAGGLHTAAAPQGLAFKGPVRQEAQQQRW